MSISRAVVRTFSLADVAGVPLVEDRELSAQMLDVLEKAYRSEERTRVREGKEMPEPRYEAHQMRALESSADSELIEI